MSIADSSMNEKPTDKQIIDAQNAIKKERHQQLISLKAALAALYVLNEKSVVEEKKLSAELREFIRELNKPQKNTKQNIITVNRTAGWAHAMREISDTSSADIRRWTEKINIIESEALCQHKANRGPKK